MRELGVQALRATGPADPPGLHPGSCVRSPAFFRVLATTPRFNVRRAVLRQLVLRLTSSGKKVSRVVLRDVVGGSFRDEESTCLSRQMRVKPASERGKEAG